MGVVRGTYVRYLCGILLIVGISSMTLGNAQAAINPQINFQGKLTNPDGTNIANGNYSIRFRVYTDPTADGANTCAANSCKWEETQATTAVADGIFRVSLGSVTALPGSIDFNSAGLYLGVKVGADAEMTPRIQFTSSPYAFNADKLDGLDAGSFLQLGPGTVQTDASVNSSIFLNKTAGTGNLLQLQKAGTDFVTVDNSGDTTFGNTVMVQNATYTSNLFTVNNGLSSAIPAFPNSYTPSMTIRASQATGSRPLFFGYDNGAGTGWSAFLTSGACGSFTQMCLDMGTGTTAYTAMENVGTTLYLGGGDDGNFTDVNFKNSGKVILGSATTDTSTTLLQLDSFDTFADASTCSTTTNQGGMYYNTKSNAIRTCINGTWEDLISTAGLGMQLFGVVPDTGSAMGDLAAATGATAGPCKVSVGANTATVSWTACVAYSGGRKVIVAAGTQGTTNATAGNFQHLCLTGTNSQPVLSTSGAETANLATVSMSSVAAPILCLADIRFAAASTTISQVYDTRVYTTTDKIPVTVSSALGLSTIVLSGTTKGAVISTTTANTNNIAGVLVASTGASSTNTINGILAISGPVAVKAITGSNTVNSYIFTSATAGYASTVTTKPTESTSTIYNVLGNARTAWSGATGCTANNDTCAGSILTYIDKR